MCVSLPPPQLLEKNLVLEEVTAAGVVEYMCMFMCIYTYLSLPLRPSAALEGPCA